MKHLLYILLLLPFLSSAQDCKLKKETDPFTHVTKLTTGFIPFNSNGMKVSLSVDATPTDIDFFFWISNDSKCFDDASTAVINFEGDRLKGNFKNSGSMNCDGAFHISFRNVVNTPSALDRLGTRKIKSIRLTGTNNTLTEITLNDNNNRTLLIMASLV